MLITRVLRAMVGVADREHVSLGTTSRMGEAIQREFERPQSVTVTNEMVAERDQLRGELSDAAHALAEASEALDAAGSQVAASNAHEAHQQASAALSERQAPDA